MRRRWFESWWMEGNRHGAVSFGTGFETSWQSLGMGALASFVLVLVAVADTVGLPNVEFAALYFLIPAVLALKCRSRMFYPVSALAVGLYGASQAISTWSLGASVSQWWAVGVNTSIQVLVALMLIRLVRTLRLLQQSADLDFLTGCLNRRGLSQVAPRFLAHVSRRRSGVAALFVDMNSFKRLNDTYGHDAGDRALVAVGRALLDFRRRTAMAARLGGDEFVLLVAADNDHEANALARALRFKIQQALDLTGLPTSASVGVSYHRGSSLTLDALLKDADRKLYSEKGRAIVAVESRLAV